MTKTIYNGFNPDGKNILITAGIHGNEYTPIYVLMQVVKDSLFSDLEIFNKINKLTLLNGINDIGLNNNQRDYSKGNTNDLNRLYSYLDIDIRPELEKYLDETDILIDIHSSKNSTEFALIDYNENLNSLVEWCKLSNIPFGSRYSNGKTLKRYIQDKGGISLTIEINGLSEVYRDSAIKCIGFVKSLLNNFDKFTFEKQIPIYDTIKEVYSYKAGFVRYKVLPNTEVLKDQEIADIWDLNGNVICTVKSDYDGVILLIGNDFIAEAGVLCLIQSQKPK